MVRGWVGERRRAARAEDRGRTLFDSEVGDDAREVRRAKSDSERDIRERITIFRVERETVARVRDPYFVRWRRHISLTARRAAARVVLVLAPGLHLVFPDRLLAPPPAPV